MMRSIWALGLVLFLAACGGGGGDSKPRVPTVDPRTAQSVTGTQPPSFTQAEILPAYLAVYTASDSLIVSDVPISYQGQVFSAETTCGKSTCSSYSAALETSVDWDLSVGSAQGLTFSAVGEKHGVKLAQAQQSYELSGLRVAAAGYGGWMNYNTFSIQYGQATAQELDGPARLAAAISAGNDTGSRPTGSATWTGLMLGGTNLAGGGNPLQGDARITYDLGRNALDAAFTDIYNLDTLQKHVVPEMRWSNVTVAGDGSFRQDVSSVNSIIGRFHGPGHAEVGGVFHHPTAIGAFGAGR